MGKRKRGHIIGRYTKEEDTFIKNNYHHMTDAEIADSLNRSHNSIAKRRGRLGLTSRGGVVMPKKKTTVKQNREGFIASLDDDRKREYFIKEVTSSARYNIIVENFDQKYRNYYVEKWVDFMMDPSIETMTASEKDALHQLIMAEIRSAEYQEEQKKDIEVAKKQKRAPISRAREIDSCTDIILKCQNSLMVERKQRLKNQSDQAVNFTSLIRELKAPTSRISAGQEAAMLKYIAEKYYNSNCGDNNIILSGKDHKFDIASQFKDMKEPELTDEFLPNIESEMEKEKDNVKEK